MNDTPRPDAMAVRRSRRQLLLIFALFAIPPLAAWVAWQWATAGGVSATTNAGQLVAPARPLELAGLSDDQGQPLVARDVAGRWTYVIFAGDGCQETCQRQLYLTRQVRLAMNKDIPRVQRLLLLAEQPDVELLEYLRSEHNDLRWAQLGAASVDLLEQFRGQGFGTDGTQYFLVDPLVNLMMFYDLEVSAKGMMRDLQKLLKISQIG